MDLLSNLTCILRTKMQDASGKVENREMDTQMRGEERKEGKGGGGSED